MLDTSLNNKRLAKNTLLLYFRMILLMGVTLYTSRVVIEVLGVTDYGIYNVVGGIVALLGFLTGTLTGTTQRFITFNLAIDDKEKLKKVFNTCQLVLMIFSLFIIVFAETIGVWFLRHKMQIPMERECASFWVYQCSVASSVIMIMSIPYNATIVAHEKMSAFSIISIIEVILKLLMVYLLKLVLFDKLVTYAILVLFVNFVIRIVYIIYCNRNFIETKIKLVFDKHLTMEMFVFTGWNIFGSTAWIILSQGLNILLNIFFGPAVNASRAISTQVQSAVSQFSTNFQMALNPQITKLYANSELESMHKLLGRSVRFTFYLLLFISMPLMIDTSFVIRIWLGTIPDFTIEFVRLMICITIIDAVSNPFMTAAAATGNVKWYQIIVGSCLLMVMPISYIVLKMGGNPVSVFVVNIFVSLLAGFLRLYIISPLIGLNAVSFIKTIMFKCLIVLLASLIVLFFSSFITIDGWYSFTMVSLFSILMLSIIIYYLGLEKNERFFVRSKVLIIVRKLKIKQQF